MTDLKSHMNLPLPSLPQEKIHVSREMEDVKERAKHDKENKSNGGTKRKRNKDSESKDEGKKSNKRKKCLHCHKTHANECRLKGTKHDKTRSNNGGIQEQVKSAVQEGITAGLNQMRVSNQPSWSKGMD